MTEDLAQEAINYALKGDWLKAIQVNRQILKSEPKDIDALNRLARAYSEIGDLEKAKKLAKKVLTIDPFDTIAKKALVKWSELKKSKPHTSSPISAQIFLEEPGKTKIVSLLHIGDPKILVSLDSGDEVFLNTTSHRISVHTKDGKYIGRLPDDLSARLKKFIKDGNVYRVWIKYVDKKEVKVFIREIKRSKKLANVPSFPSEKIDYISFTPPELVHKKEEEPEIVESEEEE